MSTTPNPYRGFRFPAAIINQAVWLYHCFSGCWWTSCGVAWVTSRFRRRERIEMKAISMKATRCSFVRSARMSNRR